MPLLHIICSLSCLVPQPLLLLLSRRHFAEHLPLVVLKVSLDLIEFHWLLFVRILVKYSNLLCFWAANETLSLQRWRKLIGAQSFEMLCKHVLRLQLFHLVYFV